MRRGLLSLISGNIVGKIVGIVREVVLAALMGTSAPVGAFRVANAGTFATVNFFTADAMSVGFLPNYTRLLLADPRRAVIFLRTTQAALFALGVVIANLLTLGRGWFTSLLAPGLSSGTLSLAAQMMTIMALAVPFYVWVNLITYLEIAHGRYLGASIRPVMQSIGLILGTVAAFLLDEPLWLAGGFTGAYVGMAVWAAIRAARAGHFRYPPGEPDATLAERREAIVLFLRTIAPVLWIPAVFQVARVVERAIASTVGERAVAALDYARLIADTAEVLLAAPLGLLFLTSLGTLSPALFRARLASVTDRVLLVCVAASGALLVGAQPVVTLVYARGAFTAESVEVTASILAGLSLGLWAQAAGYTYVKALNARGRNMPASLTVATGAVVMIIADVLLVPLLGAFGLGVGSTLGALARFTVAAVLLHQLGSACRRLLLLSPLAAGAAVLAVWAGRTDTFSRGLWALALFLAAFSAWVLAIRPLRREVWELLRRTRAAAS